MEGGGVRMGSGGSLGSCRCVRNQADMGRVNICWLTDIVCDRVEVAMSNSDPVSAQRLLGLVFVLAAFIALALTFSLGTPDGHPVAFGILLGVCAVCLLFSQQRLALLAALVAFLALRLVWAAILWSLHS